MNRCKRTAKLHGILSRAINQKQRDGLIDWIRTANGSDIRKQAQLAQVSCSPPTDGGRGAGSSRRRTRKSGAHGVAAWWKRIFTYNPRTGAISPKPSTVRTLQTKLRKSESSISERLGISGPAET